MHIKYQNKGSSTISLPGRDEWLVPMTNATRDNLCQISCKDYYVLSNFQTIG